MRVRVIGREAFEGGCGEEAEVGADEGGDDTEESDTFLCCGQLDRVERADEMCRYQPACLADDIAVQSNHQVDMLDMEDDVGPQGRCNSERNRALAFTSGHCRGEFHDCKL